MSLQPPTQPPPPTQPNPNAPKIDNVIEVWKKIIDVQQHFNDIALRIRNYALTLFTAIIGAVGLLQKEKIQISLFHMNIPASFILCFLGIVVMLGFVYMDRFWYHKLLVGAVKQALFIEKKYETQFPELGLSTIIGKESPHRAFLFTNKQVHSKQKFFYFYSPLILSLIILCIGLLFISKDPEASTVTSNQINKEVFQTDTIIHISKDKKLKSQRDTSIKQTRTIINQKNSIPN